MYGLEIGTDVDALNGCTIESITISPHQVQLHLDSSRNIGVSVEGSFAVAGAGEDLVIHDSPPAAAQVLAARIGAEVVSALVESPGALTLRLGDGSTIEIYDSEDRYESYQINIGEQLIIV